MLRIITGRPFQNTSAPSERQRRKTFWDSREEEKEQSWICVCELPSRFDFVTSVFLSCPSCLSWRSVCVFAHHGSHTFWLPAEPPRPGPGPASRLHPVPPDSARTLGPRLLPRPGLLVLILLYLLSLALHHLQLPDRRRPVSRAAPSPPPPPRPPALPAASPPASAPRVLAYPADAVARQQHAPRPLPPTLPHIPRQRADDPGPGPPWGAQYVRQHPESGQRQHLYRGLLCAGCRLWQTDSVTCRGREEERQEEK